VRSTGRVLALGLFAATLLVSVAEAGLADRIGATFSFMSGEFVKAFEPQEGLVVAVEGDTVFLDLGESSGVQVGREFVVFRKGERFRHPITGKALGQYETVLGHAHVRSISAEFSEAVFVPGRNQPGPRPEDGVRVSRGRIKVAITPLLDLTGGTADVRRVPYLFASVLDRTRRFQVVDPFAVTDMFASGGVRVEEVLARPARATHMARNLNVAGWLVPVLLERRGVTYLDITWVSAVTGTALFSRRAALTRSENTAEQRFPWEPVPTD